MGLLRFLMSKRLILRPFEYGDANKIYDMWGQGSDVTKYVTWWEHTCIEDCRNYVAHVINGYRNNDYMEWLVCLRDSGEPIGAICIFYNKEVQKWGFGNKYAKKYRHKGVCNRSIESYII